MFEAILILTLSSLNVAQQASIQPCVWPKCSKTVEVVQIQPCIWPKCSKTENVTAKLDLLGEVETCVWPKKCAAGASL